MLLLRERILLKFLKIKLYLLDAVCSKVLDAIIKRSYIVPVTSAEGFTRRFDMNGSISNKTLRFICDPYLIKN